LQETILTIFLTSCALGVGAAVGVWGARATSPPAPTVKRDLPARALRLRDIAYRE
jgi:hypothetical protein